MRLPNKWSFFRTSAAWFMSVDFVRLKALKENSNYNYCNA